MTDDGMTDDERRRVQFSHAVLSRRIDRTAWPPGPWDDEPDDEEWIHAGMTCVAERSGLSGAWCGYVILPEGHAAYGVKPEPKPSVHVHKGLTYAGPPHAAPYAGPPGLFGPAHRTGWWIGFHCAHDGDTRPALYRSGEYRDLAYVREQINKLAAYLAAYR